jgi:hypothetical protein
LIESLLCLLVIAENLFRFCSEYFASIALGWRYYFSLNRGGRRRTRFIHST